ncbi:acyl-CoA/acyl-ACP dehydrogenase [Streptomyces sp. NA04227]|uniref:acyl-CoA dehydrogenase family protein n=1 Tax=Streptomyces sp. NA04227 TaxID=2742136 RepID=UPI0015907912|nr:acyl-CoA dehydrogenase family protein [Streptomyces sp. NA04227]QKW09294.1 acyl-CoA/acyl-ACP dehydrogenase [Streptomyces sp. NA04227]
MTGHLPQWADGLPATLDTALRRAAEPGGPFDPAVGARLDAREEFPGEACAVLDGCGIAHAYVPPELGGAQGGLPELVASLRTVARRDVTVAVAHGKTYLGSVSAWVAGSYAQRRALARMVLDEHAVVSWGLTEPGRGSDLLAGQLTAVPTATGGWRLDGAKWPINNATRGRLISVLARTSTEGGARGFSLFLVDKERLAAGSWRPLPKEPTHGIRGADISGIAFDSAEIPAEALIGGVGEGLEIVLRALQLTRTVCTSLSLGAGEHALALAHDFAERRALYGTTLLQLPLARRTLGRAAASLALAEAAALLAARSAHCLPGEMSVVSALVKAGVPDLVQQTIDELAELLGARGYLTEQHADGMFQKLERDHRIVAIFDGSTAVNRSALIAQFPVLARRARTGAHDAEGLAVLVGDGPVPPLDHGALRLMSRTGCSVVQGLPTAVDRLAHLAADGTVPRRAYEAATALAEEIATVADAMAALPPASRDTPPQAFALARRYERCFAGASAAHLLLTAPAGTPHAIRLTAALERSLELLRPGHEAPQDAYEELLSLPTVPDDPVGPNEANSAKELIA